MQDKQGGELTLAILVERFRRRVHEVSVGNPQVLTKKIEGQVHEPVEKQIIAAPEEFLGPVAQLLAARTGRMINMVNMINNGTGRARIECKIRSRGLIGFRTEFLSTTGVVVSLTSLQRLPRP